MSSILHSHTLANGLKILGEVNAANVSAALGFFVKTGSRDEVGPESGVSHFLEHMMFKGTPTRSAIDVNMELGNLGAQANAFTSEENTVYYAAVIPEKFVPMQELLSDMLRPSLDEEEFATEKGVILEEIALYQDRPNFFLFEKAYQDYFSGHTAGNSVLGSHDSISALTQPQMRAYFNRRYSPSNMVLVATGNYDWKGFVSRAETLCGAWQPYDTGREVRDHYTSNKNVVFTRKNLMQSHAVLISRGCSAQDPHRYALALLAVIMGDGTGSRLYWELVDKGLADSASCESDERDGVGAFLAYVSTEPEKLDKVLDVVRRIVTTPMDFSDLDLERAKSKVLSRIVLDGEMPMGRLMAIGLEWNYRRDTTPLSEIIRRVKAVSKSDVLAALEAYPLKEWAEYRLVPE